MKPNKNKNFNLKNILQQQLKENLLLLCTIIAVVLGVLLGLIVRSYNVSKTTVSYFVFPGEVFLRMLKLLILPLISSSLIIGIAGLKNGKMGRVAARALLFYSSTTFLAAILGLFLVILIKPGTRVKYNSLEDFLQTDALKGKKINPVDTMLDLVRNLFPGKIKNRLTFE